MGGNRLDEDGFGQFLAEADPRVADLADDVGLAAEQFDFLLLTQAHFTQAGDDFRRGGQLLDADDRAGLDLAQGANGWPGALAFKDFEWRLRFLHCGRT